MVPGTTTGLPRVDDPDGSDDPATVYDFGSVVAAGGSYRLCWCAKGRECGTKGEIQLLSPVSQGTHTLPLFAFSMRPRCQVGRFSPVFLSTPRFHPSGSSLASVGAPCPPPWPARPGAAS